MKKQFFFFFALLLAGMFSFQTVNAQHGPVTTGHFILPSQWQGKTLTGTTPVHGYAITIKFINTQLKPCGMNVATMKIGNNEYKLTCVGGEGTTIHIYHEYEKQVPTGRTITLEEKANGSAGFTRTNLDGVTINSTTTLTIQ